MDDLAIIFIYSNKDKLTDLTYNSIVNNSRGYKVHAIHQNEFINDFYDFLDYRHISDWGGGEIWYWGSDNIFLYWYLSNPDKRAKQYLILEYDTYAASDILDFFQIDDQLLKNHNGIISANTIFDEKYKKFHYWWFDVQRKHPLIKNIYTTSNFAACTPLCSNMISDDATQAIIKHIQEIPHANKIYVETKFATILKYLGFEVSQYKKPEEIDDMSIYISYERWICHQTLCNQQIRPISKHVYHPIKDPETIWSFFMTEKEIVKENVHKAFFGIINDAKPAIDLLHQGGVDKILIDNSLCGDPAPGLRKYLTITYEIDGQNYTKKIPEGTVLDLSKDLDVL